MMLFSSVSLSVGGRSTGRFRKGEFRDCRRVESGIFVLAYGSPGDRRTLERYQHAGKNFALTLKILAADLVAGMHYEGLWREQVVRSFLVLHLIGGGCTAAPGPLLPLRQRA